MISMSVDTGVTKHSGRISDVVADMGIVKHAHAVTTLRKVNVRPNRLSTLSLVTELFVDIIHVPYRPTSPVFGTAKAMGEAGAVTIQVKMGDTSMVIYCHYAPDPSKHQFEYMLEENFDYASLMMLDPRKRKELQCCST